MELSAPGLPVVRLALWSQDELAVARATAADESSSGQCPQMRLMSIVRVVGNISGHLVGWFSGRLPFFDP